MSYWIRIDKDTCIDIDKVYSFMRYEDIADQLWIRYKINEKDTVGQRFRSEKERDDWFESLQQLLNVNHMGKENVKENH